MDRWATSPTEKYETANWSLRQGDEEVNKRIKENLFKYIYIFFYSFVYFFIALPQGSVCRFIFFYKFNCTDPGLQLRDPAPLIGLLLWTFWHFTYFGIYFTYLGSPTTM